MESTYLTNEMKITRFHNFFRQGGLHLMSLRNINYEDKRRGREPPFCVRRVFRIDIFLLEIKTSPREIVYVWQRNE